MNIIVVLREALGDMNGKKEDCIVSGEWPGLLIFFFLFLFSYFFFSFFIVLPDVAFHV